MEDEKKLKVALWAAVITVLVMGIALVVTTVWSVQRTADAIKYNLDCVSEPIEKPLTDCKQ